MAFVHSSKDLALRSTAGTSSAPDHVGRTAGQPGDLSAMRRSQAVLVAAMLFFLAATNAEPFVWSSLAPTAGLAGLLLLQRNPRSILAAAFGPDLKRLTILFLALAVISLISAINSGEWESIGEALLRTVAPFLAYLSLAGVRLRAEDFSLVVGGLVLGCLVLLTRGLVAFYVEWGIPDMNTLLWARYDQFRMAGYMSATLGNLSHMGLYISLLVPFLIALLAHFRLKPAILAGVLLAIGLCIANGVISGSRTTIALFFVTIGAVLARRGGSSVIAFGFVVAAATAIIIVNGLDAVSQKNLLERFIPSESAVGYDNSAVERVQSIVIGWGDFLAHPLLGVGPGLSYQHNAFGIPHQSLVYMLSEVGIFGGLVFLLINLEVLFRSGAALLAPDPNGARRWQSLWLTGPAFYLLFGLVSGLAFNMKVALVWVGLVYVMLPLAFARIVSDR